MIIARTRWLNASSKCALGVVRGRQVYSRRWFADRVADRIEAPPHFTLPSTPERRTYPARLESRVKPYYVTTPIFYPNAAPHIGHLYSLVIADIFARHARLTSRSRTVKFVTGTDEHGLKIQKAAQERNMQPQEFCDRLCVSFSGLARQANISHTKFVRTSSEEHCHGVQSLWTRLMNSGHIYLGEHSGWYSISDECFYTDSQIRTAVDPKTGTEVKVSAETGNVVEWTKEQNYKFALSKFKAPLLEHFQANPNAIYPPSQRQEIMDILESDDPKALTDLSISRPTWRLKWGIPVPDDSSQTIYVWLDALASYLTGIGYPWIDTADMVSSGWPVNLQIIGKDILKFHAIYFPAFLMALDMPLSRALLSHAHWTVKKAKMSKSVGNVIDPVAILKDHGVDEVRWYLARTGGYFKADVDWNDDQLVKSTNELRSLLGNVLLRLQSKKMLHRLPAAYQSVPLHRGILLTRGNAPMHLFEPGSEEYDDRLEDERYAYEAIKEEAQANYVKEYTDRLARPRDVYGLISERTPGVVRYSELPEPDATGEALIVSAELREALNMLRGKVSYHLQRFEVGEATQSIVGVLSLLNKEITRIRPWSADTRPRDVLHLLAWARETLRICGILLQSFMPTASQALLDALRVHPGARTYAYATIGVGRVRPGPMKKTVLFPPTVERTLQHVEADHKHDENKQRKESYKALKDGRPI
ncbi:uncharacterized protein FOMMEDRAFT_20213 [Fomitiporia mediterranea MF3/22]|uniref:uncharacterized protein n=1 Tax=Fomitiporia mediterranea (strain MF3/22) TaxID=694068 RepID=UPI0004408F51|nr:uncharacterized protein FOMMEDRAFT_20213 [Fomitiporia mediterranea MF3/22]EJD03041.1 hypothetical protein FOMMEDRAFT_20213 [Fomitiporia mediterranea MF3/22]